MYSGKSWKVEKYEILEIAIAIYVTYCLIETN